jgi:hypothetical protein
LNKIVSTKTTSAIFLAIVLVLGTIALTIPSFSVEAQATSDRDNDYDNDYEEKKSYDKDDYKSEYSSYGKYDDRDHDKSKKDSSISVSIKKVKCNNINVNLNGIDVNIGGLPINGPVTDPVAVAQEEDDDEEIESNSIESNEDESYEYKNGKSYSGADSIVCINNNNNIVGEEEPELTCEECFTENLDEEQLENLTSLLTRTDVEDLEGLCEALSDPTLSNQEKFNGLAIIFSAAEITDEDAFFKVLECLEDLGLISLPPRGSGGDGPD